MTSEDQFPIPVSYKIPDSIGGGELKVPASLMSLIDGEINKAKESASTALHEFARAPESLISRICRLKALASQALIDASRGVEEFTELAKRNGTPVIATAAATLMIIEIETCIKMGVKTSVVLEGSDVKKT